jgi:hypothetical protein
MNSRIDEIRPVIRNFEWSLEVTNEELRTILMLFEGKIVVGKPCKTGLFGQLAQDIREALGD